MELIELVVSFSSEYSSLLAAIMNVFAFIGFLIFCIGVFQIVKLGRRDNGLVTPVSSIGWKLIAGASLVNFSMWVKVWSGSLWANSNPMGLDGYSGGGSGFEAALMAALGLMVITGYVTMGRAYVMMSRIGTVQIEARSDLVWSVLSRFVAGSALIMSLHLKDVISKSVGNIFVS